jgi:O-antigen/teichoic acid export membrane protein
MSRSKNSVILSIGRVVALSLNLLTTLLLARLLTVSEYGYYQQVWLVYLVVSPVFSAGLPASILYFFPNLSPENQKTIVFQTATLLMGLGCVLSLI